MKKVHRNVVFTSFNKVLNGAMLKTGYFGLFYYMFRPVSYYTGKDSSELNAAAFFGHLLGFIPHLTMIFCIVQLDKHSGIEPVPLIIDIACYLVLPGVVACLLTTIINFDYERLEKSGLYSKCMANLGIIIPVSLVIVLVFIILVCIVRTSILNKDSYNLEELLSNNGGNSLKIVMLS